MTEGKGNDDNGNVMDFPGGHCVRNGDKTIGRVHVYFAMGATTKDQLLVGVPLKSGGWEFLAIPVDRWDHTRRLQISVPQGFYVVGESGKD